MVVSLLSTMITAAGLRSKAGARNWFTGVALGARESATTTRIFPAMSSVLALSSCNAPLTSTTGALIGRPVRGPKT